MAEDCNCGEYSCDYTINFVDSNPKYRLSLETYKERSGMYITPEELVQLFGTIGKVFYVTEAQYQTLPESLKIKFEKIEE